MTPSADGSRRPRHGTGPDLPHPFQAGPSPDHPPIPVSRPWRMAGWLVSAVAVLAVAAVVATATGEGPEYERLRPSSVVVDPRAAETVDVELRIDPEHPDAPQIRVDGDGLIRIEVDSEQFCAPATGAAGGWIDVRLCAPVRVVTVTAYDIDDDVTSAVAEF